VRLSLSQEQGLVVVVPPGFDLSRVPEILEAQGAWIERATRRVAAARRAPAASVLPAELVLPGAGEVWRVACQRLDGARQITLRADPSRRELVVSGAIPPDGGDPEPVHALLRRWLRHRAEQVMLPMLRALALEVGVGFERMSVRLQRTRWGSCSASGSISLNAKLLFVPAELVRYVMIHELCHIRHPNHSQAFWREVLGHDPRCLAHRGALRLASRYVPAWVACSGQR
jgi:predicted metal-dependent hydrolase